MRSYGVGRIQCGYEWTAFETTIMNLVSRKIHRTSWLVTRMSTSEEGVYSKELLDN